jgi:hypothetical protein
VIEPRVTATFRAKVSTSEVDENISRPSCSIIECTKGRAAADRRIKTAA